MVTYQIEVKQQGQWLVPDLLAYVELPQAIEFAKIVPTMLPCDGIRVINTVTNLLSYELDLSGNARQ
jgi:hypothetical protein